jgi:arylsulfatase A-like enzyme
MNRREFLKNCSVTTGGIFMSCSNILAGGLQLANDTLGLQIGTRRYNVLLVLADQWRFCSLGHGPNHDPVIRTPNLDKLAKEGAQWSRCYAAHPVCTPNRSSIITGRWPWETGMNENDLMLPPSERCIAQEFTDAGYKCHYIGKWHMDGTPKPGYVPQTWRRRGFITFEGFNRGHGGSRYLDSKTYDNDGNLVGDVAGTYEPTYQIDLAINFIEQNKNHPFFCYVSWGPPHQDDSGSYTPPAELDIYNDEDMILRPNVPEGTGKSRQANYFGHCTAMDYEFGRLMNTLKDNGLDENTLVVFSADHGDMLYSHGLSYKSKPEEESWHVPLIMRLPGKIKGGQVVENLVSSADLMPTILSVCGHKAPKTCTGKDKSAAMTTQGMPDESIYGGVQDTWRAVVKGDYKLVIEGDGVTETPTKMYNLKTDPYELTNLVDDPGHTTVKTDLLAEIQLWKAKTSDSFPEAPWNAETWYDG